LFPPADVSQFESIYREYFDFVWSSVRRLGVGPAAIDDVVQEVFIVIHSRLHTLEQPLAVEVDTHSRPSTPFDVVEQSDQVKLLWGILEELDEPKRDVFQMAELDELTVPEIAELLGIPLNTAYSRLRAARQSFEEALARRAARDERGGPWKT
jgi:RNA polymerase sigma-70 factor (ECF subfamily)